MTGLNDIRCERCGGQTVPETEIAPLGAAAGARIHRCPSCGHFTWERWSGGGGGASPQQSGSQAPA